MPSFRGPFAALALALAAVPALALDVGEHAPDLDVTKWFGGEPVVLEQCVGKKVVVLEIWSTFCDPCKKAIPRLSRIAEKFGPAGVDVVAVTDEKADAVEAYLKDAKVPYRVAADEERNTVVPYMNGVRNTGHAPYVYVIDKTGAVAWRGNPSPMLELVVARVASGKFDAAKAKEIAELEGPVADNYDHKQYAEAAADADKLLAVDPGNEKGILSKIMAFGTLKEPEKTKAFLEKHLPLIEDDFVALNTVAWTLATAQQFANRHPAIAVRAARRAAVLTEEKDPAVLDTLARAYYVTGMLDEALAAQTKAAALDEADEEIKKTLEHYKACVEARDGAKK